MSYGTRRYRVIGKEGESHRFEKRWDGPEGPEWFVSKAEAVKAWEAKQQPQPDHVEPEPKPARRGRPPKNIGEGASEVQTGIVE